MSNINTGGPAFPAGERFETREGWRTEDGMTLRDYFAAKVLPAIYTDYCAGARHEGWADGWRSDLAQEAYEMADAMLKAREL